MRKGWFKIDGVQTGDRDLLDQMKGLRPALREAAGATVLDLGCAEGLIAREFVRAGAAAVHGVEIVPDAVNEARRQCNGLPVFITEADLNKYRIKVGADIVLMLAILHKLRDPAARAHEFGCLAQRLAVVRLPPKDAPYVIDERSGNKPHDIRGALERAGLILVDVRRGHFNEWTGYFRRDRLPPKYSGALKCSGGQD